MPRPARTAGLLVALSLPALSSACATLLGDYQLAEDGGGGAGGELAATTITATSSSGPALSSGVTSGTSGSAVTTGSAVSSSATSSSSVTSATSSSSAASGGTLCGDGMTDGDETDVDCGGSCPPCAIDAACGNLDANCQSNNCYFNKCTQVSPTCMNGAKDFAESDVDCGGPVCPGCAANKICKGNEDCASNLCIQLMMRCAP